MAAKLDALPIYGSDNYSDGQYTYTVSKKSVDDAIQTNDSTQKQRDIRRILFDRKSGRRVVWQYYNEHNQWAPVETGLMLRLMRLPENKSIECKRGKRNYSVTKVSDTVCIQRNLTTKMMRHFRLKLLKRDAMDIGWASKVALKIDPKDVHELQLNEVNDDGNTVNNQNDDEKESESVMMNDDDKRVYSEFRKTMSKDAVEIIELKRIKANVSNMMVYDVLLRKKLEELKDKNLQHVERVLFHGTSFQNVAQIVNSGFNRDFNKRQRYGKGSYFSSMASYSAKYCARDDEDDPAKKVMLVCKVIVGEYCIGTRNMDGSSVPYKADKKTRYESCVDDMVDPTIFVINRDYHAIPTHIITFKCKQ